MPSMSEAEHQSPTSLALVSNVCVVVKVLYQNFGTQPPPMHLSECQLALLLAEHPKAGAANLRTA
jgi:hypothetical protein